MLTLDFLRHGAIDGAQPGQLYGATDHPLSDVGREQAKAAGQAMQRRQAKYDAIYCSTLSRARETLAIAGQEAGLECSAVYYDDRLREMDFGLLENYDFARIAEEYPQIAHTMQHAWSDSVFEGGESVDGFFARIEKVLEEICQKENHGQHSEQKDERILVVCHGGVIKAAICLLLRLPPQASTQFASDYAKLAQLWVSGQYATLRALNV